MTGRRLGAHEQRQAADELTIDQLAQRTGMTVRNVRAHQSRGLLPPPEVRGRTGYYGPEHVARIELIRELQADGFNLEPIRAAARERGGSSAEALRFTRALRRPVRGRAAGGHHRRGAGRALGRRRPRAAPQGREARASCARSATAATRSSARGSPAPAPSSPSSASRPRRRSRSPRELRKHAERGRRRSSSSCSSSRSGSRSRTRAARRTLPEVREALERLRPLASDSLLAMFQLAMTEAVEDRMGREVERIQRRDGSRRRR